MNKSKSELKRFIIKNLSTFSPSFLSSNYGIHQKIAIEICEELITQYEFIKKFYFNQYPHCSTPTNIQEKLSPKNIKNECESCGYYGDNFNTMVYFENNKELK